MIHDFTSHFTSDALVWSGKKKDVHAQFDAALHGIRDGLYVFLFANDSTRHVLDNNWAPKVVIRGSGASLKPGKFEKGLITRLRNYHDHLRREDDSGAVQHVFPECLKLALVLDLSMLKVGLPSPARVFERYWTESIDAFLKCQKNLLAAEQNERAEWRHLERHCVTSSVHDDIRVLVGELASRIWEMAAVLS